MIMADTKNEQDVEMLSPAPDFEKVFSDVSSIIITGRNSAYSATNAAMVRTYWKIGERIVEEEQRGKAHAQYGEKLIHRLSSKLTASFGKGFSERSLRNIRAFYLEFPDQGIWQTCLPNLTWSHFTCLLRVDDENARLWYLKEAAQENWSVRVLDRNIATQYYYRLLQAPNKNQMIEEMQKNAEKLQTPDSLIKNPVIAEFLGFRTEDAFSETALESAILSHIRDFLMEMGRGFAFVGRQQHIITDTEDYYIDLVFYNIELRCYVLIDLKMGKITHQDVGQIDMYVRMYDELKRKDGDNPTIGILLCSETSDDIARYSVLHDNDHLFMTKYLTYLPSKERLKEEIEKQKMIYHLQHPSKELDIPPDN